MQIAVISFTKNGKELADKIADVINLAYMAGKVDGIKCCNAE